MKALPASSFTVECNQPQCAVVSLKKSIKAINFVPSLFEAKVKGTERCLSQSGVFAVYLKQISQSYVGFSFLCLRFP